MWSEALDGQMHAAMQVLQKIPDNLAISALRVMPLSLDRQLANLPSSCHSLSVRLRLVDYVTPTPLRFCMKQCRWISLAGLMVQ
jgi:hypothetical protein